MSLILLAHMAATAAMAVIIWFVQIVHYPLFGKVGNAGFQNYAEAHSRLTTYVVGPPMLVEVLTVIFLLIHTPQGVSVYLAWAGAALVAVFWLSTALLQVPLHRTLGGGPNQNTHHALVATNWVRTIAWSVRVPVAALLLPQGTN